MPLPKRAIVPVNVSNIVVPKEVDNELEYVANATLSNLTRQLASLSLQAADLFSELTDQLMEITNRNERLNHRIETIKITLSETAIREDDLMIGLMSLQSNPYKSRMEADQQVLNKNSMPHSIAEMYQQCEPPPALEQLDRFRYDNKQSMKFYTDPNFFFHLWCQEMLHDTKQKKKKKKRRVKKQPSSTKRSDSQSNKTNFDSNKVIQNGTCNVTDSSSIPRVKNASFNGFELPPPLLPPMECHNVNLAQPQFNYEDVSIYNTIVPPKDIFPMPNSTSKGHQRPESEPNDIGNISPPPPAMSYLSHKPGAHPMSSISMANTANQHIDHNNDVSFRTQPVTGGSQESKPIPEATTSDVRTMTVPPPPAPPPPPSVPPPPSAVVLPNTAKPHIYAVNAKSIDLLTAIRNGIHLRKVGDDDKRPVPITEAVYKAEKKFDVQAIFEEVYKRRPYVDNNSDSEDGSEEDEDSSLWSSDNDK